ncbi:MAG: leucine--tRNA ligase [Candidatus Bathyarchaeia archaeon]
MTTPLDWKEIEAKWRKRWEESRIFEADPDPNKRKCFVTFPFPYMNGPLHVGHGFTATRADAYARFKRMQGYNTLFPWAWHWTGEPILGAALRVKMGDEGEIRALKEIDGVPEEELANFSDPIYMANYYTREGREILKAIGYSVDWRREFHTTYLEPTFSRFVDWQCETLRKKGYVARGTHPVVWCPNCESPTGDHDRLEGEGVSPEEYTLLKFPFGDAYLPAATFRPETIYGVTNMFLNPEAAYVEAEVNGEKWMISKQAAEKLGEQLRKVTVLREFKGSELIGKYFRDPITSKELPILPGWFVDPESATGVVYSVPAHAPADWIAIKDLVEHPEKLKEFGIDPDVVEKIKPISLISVEGYGEYPAIEIIEKIGAKDQFDPKVDEATAVIYKKEFHTGVLKPICDKYAGKLVKDVKAELIEDFKGANIADSMHDLPQRVVCRCMTRCIVKILSDQWFLRYSDPEWKGMAHEAVDKARIFPEAARAYFHDRIDWLREWACARRTGLGTPLPWSPGWIVETLSDSTIYMAFYTIVKHIRKHNIKPEQLTNAVFNYIFLGGGDVEEIGESSKISPSLLREMRDELTYWYPVDLRVSAKDLVPNHLSFFLFQHTALFPKEHWPRSIGVNGILTIEGNKMSKSRGNFVTLKTAVNRHGADVTRLTLLLAAQDMDDPDWREENAKSIDAKLRSLRGFVNQVLRLPAIEETRTTDRWLLSVMQKRIREVTDALEILKTRTAAEVALFEVWNDIRWYLRRTDNPNSAFLREAVDIWIRLLAPFAPYICEELWHAIGNDSFVSTAEWPSFDQSKVDVKAEETENFIKNLMEDTTNVMRATKITPRKIHYYVAAPWKWKAYLKAVEEAASKEVSMKDLMKEFMSDLTLRKEAKKLAQFISQAIDEINRMPEDLKLKILKIGAIDEERILKESKEFLRKEFRADIFVFNEEDPQRHDPRNRARMAKPYRPAIYIE